MRLPDAAKMALATALVKNGAPDVAIRASILFSTR
jgi:hypothetical protein